MASLNKHRPNNEEIEPNPLTAPVGNALAAMGPSGNGSIYPLIQDEAWRNRYDGYQPYSYQTDYGTTTRAQQQAIQEMGAKCPSCHHHTLLLENRYKTTWKNYLCSLPLCIISVPSFMAVFALLMALVSIPFCQANCGVYKNDLDKLIKLDGYEWVVARLAFVYATIMIIGSFVCVMALWCASIPLFANRCKDKENVFICRHCKNSS